MKSFAILGAVSAIALGSLAAGTAIAQNYDNTNVDDDIVVTSPHPDHADRDGATGAPIDTLVTREYVSYDDLNLNHRADRQELRWRVADAANRACDRLDNEVEADGAYGETRDDCRANAVQSAHYQVRQAIIDAGW